jgi:type IV secretory pathway VirB10-like protein
LEPRTEITNVRIAHGTLVLALLGTAASGADIYRSTAADGTVSYSDRPQDADAQFVAATPGAAAQRPAAPPAQTRSAAAAPAAMPQAPGTPTLPDGPSSRELREERQKNCEVARERQQRYTLSRRLFQTNAAGEREYLDDAAVAEARAKAAQDVQDWCE